MYAVDSYAAVRRFIFVEGKSRREAARVFGLSRDTISKMCRFSAPPGYVRTKPPGKPKLGLFTPTIDAILAADITAPPKQRHTAKRIYERLCIEHRFEGGYTVVKDYVTAIRHRRRDYRALRGRLDRWLRAPDYRERVSNCDLNSKIQIKRLKRILGRGGKKANSFLLDLPSRSRLKERTNLSFPE